ncbi:hypothetical protein B7R21_03640 [Subtercola boreus]|uniref:Uncharacterized protein n=1 Tax=Subtercola boreus TaxID=120213 RepID=A0A3E0W3W6_9MICO|nr:hypothetical protein [Subtercola boreus]RFA15807.1 hypothetical protein B7R21_03640 [Subtercola boreus]
MSPAFDALGPILIQPTHGLDQLAEIAATQNRFGENANGRIAIDRISGKMALVIVVKLGQHRAVISRITPEIAEAIQPVAWRLRLNNHAIKCLASVDANPDSPTYLHVWLNPELSKAPNPRRESSPVS